MNLPVKLVYAPLVISILSAVVLVLAYRVVAVRKSHKIGLGDGDENMMQRRIRAHANLLENMLPFSFLYFFYEFNGGDDWLLAVSGAIFVVARILHAMGLSSSSGRTFGRYYGTLFSWLVILILLLVNIWLVVQ